MLTIWANWLFPVEQRDHRKTVLPTRASGRGQELLWEGREGDCAGVVKVDEELPRVAFDKFEHQPASKWPARGWIEFKFAGANFASA